MSNPSSTTRRTGQHGAVRPGSVKDGDLSQPIELLDFMNELGVIMQLPPRRPTAAVAAIAEPAPQTRVGRRLRASEILLPVVAVGLLGAVAASRLTSTPAVTELPTTLVGEWVTEHPAYKERRLSFTSTSVAIAMNETQVPAIHTVLSVTQNGRADSSQFDIVYDSDGSPVHFKVNYVANPSPRVVLQNPGDVVWTPYKAPAGPGR